MLEITKTQIPSKKLFVFLIEKVSHVVIHIHCVFRWRLIITSPNLSWFQHYNYSYLLKIVCLSIFKMPHIVYSANGVVIMADQQQFFLKWNDFQSNMVTSFRHLRDEKSFTDVTLACEGQTCKAHKMVLSACSPYFKSLLEVSLYTLCNVFIHSYLRGWQLGVL